MSKLWICFNIQYLNSGAGGIGAAFVNERHHERIKSTSLKGWWGNRSETRFEMRHNMDSADGADTLRLCNPPPFLVALNKAGLEVFTFSPSSKHLLIVTWNTQIFEEATIQRLLTKQHLLTGYLEYLLDEINDSAGGNLIDIITPRDPARRGSQLSLIFSISLEDIHSRLEKRGVVVRSTTWINNQTLKTNLKKSKTCTISVSSVTSDCQVWCVWLQYRHIIPSAMSTCSARSSSKNWTITTYRNQSEKQPILRQTQNQTRISAKSHQRSWNWNRKMTKVPFSFSQYLNQKLIKL